MAQSEGVSLARRGLLAGLPFLASMRPLAAEDSWTYAVTGRIGTAELGVTLPHEHVLVDFVGADKVSRDRYDVEEVIGVVLPRLEELKRAGCRTLVECTPAYLGRDPQLLLRLARASGVTLLTNTGYYGAAQDKYLTAHAFDETAERLAARWTAEFTNGIEGSGVRPAFVKIGVDSGPLSAIDRKLVRAAALCHKDTGLVIACHTGNGEAAFDALETLRAERVSPEAFVWVHAQNERETALHLKAVAAGAWVSFDGIRPASLEAHVQAVRAVIEGGLIGRVLVSQDAGWYRVGEPRGGEFRAYTGLFEEFLPSLRKAGATEDQVRTLLVANPAKAFAIRLRMLPG
jgi:predicted metal-dependent phosphotriesterase family hydrolase